MKRWVAAVAVVALAMSGCEIGIDTLLVVNEDESGEVSVFVGLDEELRQLVEAVDPEGLDLVDQASTSLDGWEVAEATMGRWQGARVSTSFESLEDLTSMVAALGGESSEGTGVAMLEGVDLELEGRTMRFSAELDGIADQLTGSVIGSDLEGLGLDDPFLLNDLIAASLRVELPGEIGDHNADSVDGNQLSWSLDLAADTIAVFAESEVSGIGSLLSTLSSIDFATELFEDGSGAATVTLQIVNDSDLIREALPGIVDWEVGAGESSDVIQLTTTFDSDRSLKRQLRALREQSAVGELIDIFADIDFRQFEDKIQVEFEIAELANPLSQALADGVEMTVQLDAPGSVVNSNSDDQIGDSLTWRVASEGGGGPYFAVVEPGSFPLLLVLLSLLVIAAVGVGVFLRLRRQGDESELH